MRLQLIHASSRMSVAFFAKVARDQVRRPLSLQVGTKRRHLLTSPQEMCDTFGEIQRASLLSRPALVALWHKTFASTPRAKLKPRTATRAFVSDRPAPAQVARRCRPARGARSASDAARQAWCWTACCTVG